MWDFIAFKMNIHVIVFAIRKCIADMVTVNDITCPCQHVITCGHTSFMSYVS